jgi:amino acid adenylation domain-containing protein
MGLLLGDVLSASAEKHPDCTALRFEKQVLSYGELEGRSNALAHCLREVGVRPRDRVAISMRRGLVSVVGITGIMKAGAAYVPVDPLSPASRLEYILKKCEIRILLTSRERLGGIQQVLSGGTPLQTVMVMDGAPSPADGPGPRILDASSLSSADAGRRPDAHIADTDYAYVLFTSGSTGSPKGVMISHRNSLAFVEPVADFFAIRTDDRLSNVSPLHFDLSVIDYFISFKKGASTVIVPEVTTMFPAKLCACIEEQRMTVWNSVPSLLSMMANYGSLASHDLSSLRLILFAGEVFPVKYLRVLQRALPEAAFYNVYGQTEANSSTYFRVDTVPDDDNYSIPIGQTFPGFEVFALDENGRIISDAGEVGELYVRSDSVAAGYWGEPEKTRQAFVEDPLLPGRDRRVYRTGDLVTLDEAGNYLFLGRKDHMIKSRGYRIELGEIEAAIINHRSVKQAIAVPVPDELIGNRLAVLIVLSEPGTVSKEEIARHCGRLLPKYMVPEMIEFRESLPMTSSGKVDRQSLARLLSQSGPDTKSSP